MTTRNAIISQTVVYLRKKYPQLDQGSLAYLTNQANRILTEFELTGMNVTAEIVAARLDGFIRGIRHSSRSMVEQGSSSRQDDVSLNTYGTSTTTEPRLSQEDSLKSVPTQRLSRSSTGEKLPSRSISRSTSDSELIYSLSNPKSQKILVNVIRDEAISPIETRIHRSKSKTHHKTPPQRKDHSTKKNIYSSTNALIGSKTIEDLLKVAAQTATAASKVDRVIIIDRPKTKSPKPKVNQTEKARSPTYEMRSGLVAAPSMANMAHSSFPRNYTTNTTSNYYTSQPTFQSDVQWFMITPYASNVTNYYQPFVYYSY